MRKKYWILACLLVVITLLICYVTTQFRFVEVNLPITYSPEEAEDKNILIRKITPDFSEFDFNEQETIIITSAWLEKFTVNKNRFFWVEKNIDPTLYLVKISYFFRDKETGRKSTSSKDDVLIEAIDLPKDSMTLQWGNVSGIVVKGTPRDVFSLKIYNGVNQGKTIQFH